MVEVLRLKEESRMTQFWLDFQWAALGLHMSTQTRDEGVMRQILTGELLIVPLRMKIT